MEKHTSLSFFIGRIVNTIFTSVTNEKSGRHLLWHFKNLIRMKLLFSSCSAPCFCIMLTTSAGRIEKEKTYCITCVRRVRKNGKERLNGSDSINLFFFFFELCNRKKRRERVEIKPSPLDLVIAPPFTATDYSQHKYTRLMKGNPVARRTGFEWTNTFNSVVYVSLLFRMRHQVDRHL